MSASGVTWVVPGGMSIPEQSGSVVSEPCLVAYADGRNQLGNLLRFFPQTPDIDLQGNHQPEPQTLPLGRVRWLRLLRPVHLHRGSDNQPFGEQEWERILKDVEIEFHIGESIRGRAAALLQDGLGWYFFLVKDTAEAYRYFIPHEGVDRVLLNGDVQPRVHSVVVVRKMKHAQLADILKDTPEKYPFALEAKYERVLHRIMGLWHDPLELEPYFEDLLVDKRGGRQGFPQDVVHDIYVLSMVYDDYLHRQQAPIDPWAAEQAKQELEEKYGMNFLPGTFHKAIERNNVEATMLYLNAGMGVDTPGEAGWTPLMVASFNGNEHIAELLLQRGANAFAADGAGYTPLHWAAFNGFSRVTRILLAKHVPVDVGNRYGWTPLLQAAARGHVEVVKLLLDHGAEVNRSDNEGWAPLHKAVVNKHIEVVKMLLKAGANPRAQHKNGTTPVQLALDKNLPDIHRLLLHALEHPVVAARIADRDSGALPFE